MRQNMHAMSLNHDKNMIKIWDPNKTAFQPLVYSWILLSGFDFSNQLSQIQNPNLYENIAIKHEIN